MKKILVLLLALSMLCLVAGVVMAAVSGTPHDLRTNTAIEICAFCHTPHQGPGTAVPLWNRNQAAQTYTLYTSTVSGTFDMSVAAALRDPSTLCMGCHNGVASSLINYPGPGSTANANYNATVAGGTLQIGSGALDAWTNLGVDLRNEHPVSFNYNPALDTATQNNGFPPLAGGTVVGAVTGARYQMYASGAATESFECATCHNVHHTVSGYGEGSTQVYFLRTSNAASSMCRDCHVNR